MTRYLISFDARAMTFPEEELPAVSEAVHAMMREAQVAGQRHACAETSGGRETQRRLIAGAGST